MELVTTIILNFVDTPVFVRQISMALSANSIIEFVNLILVGIMVYIITLLIRLETFFFLGTCIDLLNKTFLCQCEEGWTGTYCETKINYCDNVKCQNNGVCRPLFRSYRCECLGDSFSGQHCEIVAKKIQIYQIASKSFAYIAIITMVSVAMFIVIMDILKYCFGIDPVNDERERLRQQRNQQVKKLKPVIQRFIYVNAPVVSSLSK